MRVAIFTESYHEINGIGRTYRQMSEYAQGKGLELDIYINGDGTVENFGTVSVFNIKVDAPIEYYPGMMFDAWTVPRHIFNILPKVMDDNFKRKGYDIIMLATQGSMGLYAISAARKYHIPMIGSYHTQVPLYAEMRMESMLHKPKGPLSVIPKLAREATYMAEGYYYRKPLFNLAPTNMICDLIGHRFKRPTRVFRRGIDIERFHPSKGREKDGRTALFVSRISVEKNVDMLIGFGKAVPGARLIIVGDGPDKERLEREIPEAEFKGFITGEKLFEEFASADVFIFPSITETYGNVVQEAMASGLPVVLDSRGPSSELVRTGIDGLHYRSQNNMFSCIRHLLNDDALRERMSSNAREAMERRTWEAVFDSVYDGYEEALNIHSSKPISFREKWDNFLSELRSHIEA
jgi:glycosyltransferase involved in cell wall biosynthesis